MKIDVQGFESQVISGAAGLLHVIDAIVVEQAFEPFYEGQLPFAKLNASLAAAGFVMSRV